MYFVRECTRQCIQVEHLQDLLPNLEMQHKEANAELATLRAQIAEVLPFLSLSLASLTSPQSALP